MRAWREAAKNRMRFIIIQMIFFALRHFGKKSIPFDGRIPSAGLRSAAVTIYCEDFASAIFAASHSAAAGMPSPFRAET